MGLSLGLDKVHIIIVWNLYTKQGEGIEGRFGSLWTEGRIPTWISATSQCLRRSIIAKQLIIQINGFFNKLMKLTTKGCIDLQPIFMDNTFLD